MKRSYPTFLGVCIASVALLTSTVLPSVAASFSGTVIDEDGKPVSNVIVGFSSFAGDLPPNRHHRPEPMFPPPQPSETDETGAFSIIDIASPAIHTLILMPEREAEYEFQSIKIDGVTFHLDPQMHRWQGGGLPFTIEQDADVKDVEITVRLRMRIRGRVLSADGTPLGNAKAAAESPKSPQAEDVRQRYTVLVGLTEKWQITRHGSPLARLTERAILEKENLIIGAPESNSDTEKR